MNYEICELSYSFGVTPSIGAEGVSFDSNALQRMFTYEFNFDANYIQTYEVTVTVLVAQAQAVAESVSWDLEVLYPCQNLDLITISGLAPDQQTYYTSSRSLVDPFVFAHDPFTVNL